MGRVYKRGNTWYIDYRWNGERIRRKVGGDKSTAKLVLKKAEIDIAKQEAGLGRQKVKFSKFLKEHREHVRATNSPGTIRRYRACLDNFESFIAPQGLTWLSDVTPMVIERYKAKRLVEGAQPKTVNVELDAVSGLFSRAVKLELLETNPVAKAGRAKEHSPKPPRFLSAAEIERVKQACDGQVRDIFEVLIETGMRRGEIENLQWSDVDLANGWIHIQPRGDWTPKHGRSRKVPMRPRVSEILLHRRREAKHPWVFHRPSGEKVGHLWCLLSRAYKKAGVRNACVHTTRHTFASHAVMSGVDLYTVGKLLGHSDVKTTQVYAHLAQDHLKRAANLIRFGLRVIEGTGKAQRASGKPEPVVLEAVRKPG